MTYEYEGKTEKEAIELAASELNLERDQFDVEILETQKNSLFKKGYVRIKIHTFDDEGNKETKSLFPGRKLQPATSKQNEMLFFGWEDGSGKKWDLVPDTSRELTAVWSNRISSPNGRLTVKMDKDKRLYELEVTQLEEEPRPDQFWKFYNFTIKENATTRLGINIKETIEFENKQNMFMKDVTDTDHLWTYTVKFPFAKKGEKLRFIDMAKNNAKNSRKTMRGLKPAKRRVLE